MQLLNMLLMISSISYLDTFLFNVLLSRVEVFHDPLQNEERTYVFIKKSEYFLTRSILQLRRK